jgi:hypothetical protein
MPFFDFSSTRKSSDPPTKAKQTQEDWVSKKQKKQNPRLLREDTRYFIFICFWHHLFLLSLDPPPPVHPTLLDACAPVFGGGWRKGLGMELL